MVEHNPQELANLIDACADDAVRPIPHPAYADAGISQMPDVRIVCLANGLKAIAAALRAGAEGEG